jgi:hypothetical protein
MVNLELRRVDGCDSFKVIFCYDNTLISVGLLINSGQSHLIASGIIATLILFISTLPGLHHVLNGKTEAQSVLKTIDLTPDYLAKVEAFPIAKRFLSSLSDGFIYSIAMATTLFWVTAFSSTERSFTQARHHPTSNRTPLA